MTTYKYTLSPLATLFFLGAVSFPFITWFMTLHTVTRIWFGGSLLTTCAGNFGMINIFHLVWSFNEFGNFEIWRLLTPFLFVGKTGYDTLLDLYMIYQFSEQYEAGGPYNIVAGGGALDYIFMLMLGGMLILISYASLNTFVPAIPLFTTNLSFYVLYIWSTQNPMSPANVLGFQMKSYQLPFAYFVIAVLMRNPPWGMVHGIACGHVFCYLLDMVPLDNRAILRACLYWSMRK
mmetsp:Transcript_24116/g.35071  ORF Transcript_24116/g.35071 Transcript_24116/m.35071 type:complete len:234 (+) Transcript_24116:122-823(+)